MVTVPIQPVTPETGEFNGFLAPNPSTNTYSITTAKQGLSAVPILWIAAITSTQPDAQLTFDLHGWTLLDAAEINSFNNDLCLVPNIGACLTKLYWRYASTGSGTETFPITLGALSNGVLFGLIMNCPSGYFDPGGFYVPYPNPFIAHTQDINASVPPAVPYDVGPVLGGLLGSVAIITVDIGNVDLQFPTNTFPPSGYPDPPSPWLNESDWWVYSSGSTTLVPAQAPLVSMTLMTQTNDDVTNTIGSGAISYNTAGNGGYAFALNMMPVTTGFVPPPPPDSPFTKVITPQSAISLPCTPCCCMKIGYPI